MTKTGLPYLAEVFKDFQYRWNPNYRPANPDIPFPNKPSATDPLYGEELQQVRIAMEHELIYMIAKSVKRGLSRLRINIKVIGVWDTVGKAKCLLKKSDQF